MVQDKKTAEFFATQQRDISVSEFFEKNKHLLGFDNPTKALLMVVKEAVDNSLDACEEARILPDIKIKIKTKDNEVYTISVEDNGPGIVKEQIPKIFGKLLYGSKFHKLSQSRGQQGLGISSSVLYSQLTTGHASRIYSRTGSSTKTHLIHMRLDTMKNEAEITKEEILSEGDRNAMKNSGTRFEADVIGRYRKSQGVDEYLEQTAVANPFAKIEYQSPDGTELNFSRAVNELPKEPKEMKPHPYGVELGILMRMLKNTKSRSISNFLQNEFSSVGSTSANEVVKISKIDEKKSPHDFDRDESEKLLKAMQKVKIQRPPLDCLSPIGKDALEKGLKKLYPNAEFIVSHIRPPEVYRGNPFIIETAIVYGGDLPKEDSIKIIRLANRVPLMFQAGAGAANEAITTTAWKRYGLQQSGNGIPSGPAVIIVHMCSTWVPFISESKEAVAPYPEIVKEMKLALQDCGRHLGMYLRKQQKAKQETRRLHIFEDYFPLFIEISKELAEIKDKIDVRPLIENVINKGLVEDKEIPGEKQSRSSSGED